MDVLTSLNSEFFKLIFGSNFFFFLIHSCFVNGQEAEGLQM